MMKRIRKLKNSKEDEEKVVFASHVTRKVLVIHYGLPGDPHAYFVNPEDEGATIWDLISKKQLFDIYSFFETHELVDHADYISLETPIQKLAFDLMSITDENSGEAYDAWCAEFSVVEVASQEEETE